jgi:hypothetical protein
MNPGEQQMVKAFASSPMVPFITPDDCGPGMVLPAFADPEQLAILVAGDPGGNVVLWISPVGSTTVSPDIAATVTTVPPAFMTRKIRGATLTEAGR